MAHGRNALRLVNPETFREEVKISEGSVKGEVHSLHHALEAHGALLPATAGKLIERFTRRGSVVLDPYARGGHVGLEANQRGRVFFGASLDPLSLAIIQGRTQPVDL